MEKQQRVLYVVFSVIVVLFVITAIAVIFLVPPEEAVVNVPSDDQAREAGVDNYDPSVWVTDDQQVPEFSPETPSEDGVIVIGVDQGASPEAAGEVESPEESAVSADSAQEAPVLSVPLAKDLPKPEAPGTSSRSQTAPAAQARTVRVTEYWIQAGSYTSRSRARSSQEELKENGFVCRIVSKTIDGENFYRLRMGPYESKEEAEKFLGWIRGLDSYKESYISEVYVQKTL